MKAGSWNRAYYIELEEGEELERKEVQIGNHVLQPGHIIARLGREGKKRSCFELREGWKLRFQGWFADYILFDTVNSLGRGIQGNLFETRRIFYAFGYVNPEVLFVCTGPGQGYDIRLDA